MNEIVSNQSLLFMNCVQIGIIMGVLFDIIRIFRKAIKHSDFFVQLEDFTYWIICALIGFYMLYIKNYAAIRPFVFVGILLGAVLYFASFSILFMKTATIIINYIKKVIKQLLNLLFIPIKAIIRMMKIPLKYLRNQSYRINYYKRRKLGKLKRKWYYAKAEIRTEIKIRKNKK